MKKTRVTSLLLLSLFLVGCRKETSNETSSRNYISQEPASSVSSHKGTSTPVSSTSRGTKDSSSGSSSGHRDTDWPTNVANAMVEYLGGESGILPFLDIGTRSNSASYDTESGKLIILGGLNQFGESTLSDAKAVFDSASGWEASIQDDVLTAVNSTLGITVTLRNDNGTPVLEATYLEPYDPSKGTDWSQDTKAAFHLHLHNHILPYFYPGTARDTTIENKDSSFTIRGGEFREEILTKAKTALQGDNADNINWVFPTVEEDATYLVAYKTYEDGYTAFIRIRNNSGRCFVDVFYASPLTLPAKEDQVWPENVSNGMTKQFGFVLPYVYLGANTIEFNPSSTTGFVYVTAQTGFSYAIFSEAKQAFDNDKDVTWATSFSYSSAYGLMLNISGIKGDRKLTITVFKVSDGITMRIRSEQIYDPSHQEGDWLDSTKNFFKTNLDGYDFPYVYLGVDQEQSTYSSTYKCVSITGGVYDEEMLTNLNTALTNDSTAWGTAWTITKSDTTGKILHASKIVEEVNDDQSKGKTKILTALFDGTKANVVLKLSYAEIPSDAKWSDEAKTAFQNILNGYDMPYLYLEEKSPSMEQSDNSVTFTGGEIDNTDFYACLSILEKDGWTVALDGGSIIDSLSASKRYQEGTLTLNLQSIFEFLDYISKLIITYTPDFKLPSEEESHWSEKTASEIATFLGKGKEVPFILLNSKNPKNSPSSNCLTLEGGKYDDRMIDFNVDSLTKDTHVSYLYSNKEGKKVSALLTFDDGSYAILVFRKKSMSDNAVLKIYKYDAVTIDNTKDWDSEVKKGIQEHFASYPLPYFDVGSKESPTTINYETEFAAIYKDYNPAYIFNAKTVLENDGFTVTLDADDFGPKLTATKEIDDHIYTVTLLGDDQNDMNLRLSATEKK